MLRGRLMRRGREPSVPPAAPPAACDHKTIAGLSEIVQHLARLHVVNNRADRRGDVDGMAIAALFVAALSVTAALGLVFGIKAEVKKCVVVLAGHQSHVTAASAVAAAGTASVERTF